MHRFANPARFLRLLRWLLPITALLALLLLTLGQYLVWFVAPLDYQQGETVRIMYIHVPAATLGLGIYGLMTAASISFLVWRHPLASLATREAAPLGALFTLMCLVTGALWGKPMWGAYWVWDARLTSMLILFFLYLGYMALASAHEQRERGQIACGWLCIVGALNLPIIKFSVEWWNTLHQPASISWFGDSSIHPSMLHPLLLMLAGSFFLFLALLFLRMRTALMAQKLRRLQMQSIAIKSAHHQPAETLELR